MASVSASGSSSYSALLRRSKLASYQPQIEQVYVASSGHKARQQFGFKRPLPRPAVARTGASSNTDALVSVKSIDDRNRRTEWRPAGRETAYVRRIAAANVAIVDANADNSQTNDLNGSYSFTSFGLPDRFTSLASSSSASASTIAKLPIQSRFVPENFGGKGSIVPIEQLVTREASPTGPNFFAMDDRSFEALLARLGKYSQRFIDFIKLDLVRSSGRINDDMSPSEVQAIVDAEPPVDLYTHAQKKRMHLEILLERFIALHPQLSKVKPNQLSSTIHPLLGLRYQSPTKLERHLDAPVPGRLLGPGNESANSNPYSRSGTMIATVLGQIATLHQNSSGGNSMTNFFPDAQGERSNIPGQAHFNVVARINSTIYANQTLPSRINKNRPDFASTISPYEPHTLATGATELAVTINPTQNSRKPILGSQEYAGTAPTLTSSPHQAYTPSSLLEIMPPRASSGSSTMGMGGAGTPFDRIAIGSNHRTGAEQRGFEENRKQLMAERKETDAKVFKTTSGGGRRNEQLMKRLEALLAQNGPVPKEEESGSDRDAAGTNSKDPK